MLTIDWLSKLTSSFVLLAIDLDLLPWYDLNVYFAHDFPDNKTTPLGDRAHRR